MIPWLPFFTYSTKQRKKRNIRIENGEIHIEIPIYYKKYEKPSSASTSGIQSALLSEKDSVTKLQVSPQSRSPRATPSPHSKTSQKSQPTSARKSPTPIAATTEAPPKPTKNQKKGFETSRAMLELFGYDSSGTSSCFEQIPAQKETKNYGRKNLLQKEMNQPTEWEVTNNISATSSCFQVKDFTLIP